MRPHAERQEHAMHGNPDVDELDTVPDDVGPHQGETEDDHRSPDKEDTHMAD
jgi:hypothetical protein